MPGRTPLRLALVAGVLLIAAGPLRGAVGGGAGERPAARIPDPPARGVPPQFAEIVSGMRDVQRRSLAGRLAAIAGGGPPNATTATARPFADHGSRRRIAGLQRDVDRALRRVSTPDDRVTVVAWQGVYVSGRRAVALADVRRAVRSRRGMPFRRLPIARTRLELVREGRAWRILDAAGLRR